MSEADETAAELKSDAPTKTRGSIKLFFDRIFLYGTTLLAIYLAAKSMYSFLTGDWTLAEGLATAAKLIAIVAVAYFIRTRFNR